MKRFVKRMLPVSLVTHIWHVKQWTDRVFVRLFLHAGFLSRAYYLFFNGGFSFENRTVMAGRHEYHRRLLHTDYNQALLRRNIHRLEKGMIMVPRRNLFGTKYIYETVVQFERLTLQRDFEVSEAKWANDVLAEYFTIVTGVPVISMAEVIFHRAQENIRHYSFDCGVLSVPSPASTFKIEVDVSTIEQLILSRKSTRWFEQRRVPERLIDTILGVSASAPSACNRQPYRVIALSEDESIASVAELASGTAGFFHQIPNLLVWIGDLSAYPFERDRHAIFIDSSLAAMQFMLLSRGHGLETCMLNWPEIKTRDEKVGEILGLKDYERVVFLMAVGFPRCEALVPFSQKKERVVTFR